MQRYSQSWQKRGNKVPPYPIWLAWYPFNRKFKLLETALEAWIQFLFQERQVYLNLNGRTPIREGGARVLGFEWHEEGSFRKTRSSAMKKISWHGPGLRTVVTRRGVYPHIYLYVSLPCFNLRLFRVQASCTISRNFGDFTRHRVKYWTFGLLFLRNRARCTYYHTGSIQYQMQESFLFLGSSVFHRDVGCCQWRCSIDLRFTCDKGSQMVLLARGHGLNNEVLDILHERW